MIKTYILDTYGSDLPEDGLSIVYHRIKSIAPVIRSCDELKDRSIVLIAGIPTLYSDLINTNHINIAYTTYEHFPLPQEWIETLHLKFSAVIVPHPKIKELFEKSGVKIPIHVVQQGYTRLPGSFHTPSQNEHFTLGFLGVPVDRKNLQLLIKAVEEIHPNIPTRLKVHVSKYYDWLPAEEWRRVLADHPLIEYTEGYKDEKELGLWYTGLSAYIFPSSGEGWSFTPRESIALSVPSIISKIDVHTDLYPYACTIENPISIPHIKDAIIQTVNNYNEFIKLAQDGSRWIIDKYKNENISIQLRDILDHYSKFIF